MKRTIFIILLSSIVSNLFGQIYIQPSVSYSISNNPKESLSISIIDNLKTVQKIKLKYGEGVHLGISIGYNFLNNIFIELNAKQTIYSNYNVSTVQPNLQDLNNFMISGYFGDLNYKQTIYQITPLIGFQVQKYMFSTFIKFGPNFMKSTINHTYEYIDWVIDERNRLKPLNAFKIEEYTGRFHVGLQANIGFCYSIKNNLSLVIDFVTVYNNYEITKAEIKHLEIDGVNQFSELEGPILNEIDKNNNKINLSHYGINIGLKYIFNKNK